MYPPIAARQRLRKKKVTAATNTQAKTEGVFCVVSCAVHIVPRKHEISSLQNALILNLNKNISGAFLDQRPGSDGTAGLSSYGPICTI
jgi:hypothetical protein